MTYSFRKKQAGQEVVKKLTIFANACKYTSGDFVIENNLATNNLSVIPAGVTGVSLPVNQIGGSNWLSTWSSYPTYPFLFFVLKDEIIKVEVVSSTLVTIVERALFGTTPASISRFSGIEINHEGRLDKSCFGYSQSCSNPDTYQDGLFKQLVFSSSPLPSGSIYHGGLLFKDASYSSSEIKPGESISSRSRLSFKILDQKHNGYDVVYWPEQRTTAGTFFGKLLAMHPYFNGRKIKYSVGLRTAGVLTEPDWEDRNLLIDSVNLSGESFSGIALDPLILTEGRKAKMPLVSPAQLTTLITSSSTHVQFANAPSNYFGTSGNIVVRIDSELIQVTANNTLSMPIVTRGFGNSEIKDHSINATVQNCIRFINEHVINCITYALTTWTTTPTSYIDDYSSVIALIPTAIISDYTLSSPKDVVDFINLMIFVGNLTFYFDDVAEKIVIKYISEFNISPIYLSDSETIKKESARRDFNLKEQYTRFNLSWAPFDLTKDTDDKNFQISLTPVNLEMESANKLGEVNERKAMMLPVLNTTSADYLLGAAAVNRVVSAAIETPDIFECELDAESIGETQNSVLELGSIVSVQSNANQNKAGIAETRLYQVLKISGDAFESFKVKMKHFQLSEPSEYDFIIEEGTYINYVLTDHFNPLSAGEYTIYIKTGAIFGSYSTGTACFRTGVPTAGVSFKFIARWQLLGMGGAGGDAGIASAVADAGEVGGIAFEANCNCIIDNGAGLIWAGGGGATGEYYVSPQGPGPYYVSRRGGGGGQGFGTSIGGRNTNGMAFTDRAENGSQSAPGVTNCPDAGEWGEQGASGYNPTTGNPVFGGLAGIAIKSNGFSVNIIAGDNALSIRGRRT